MEAVLAVKSPMVKMDKIGWWHKFGSGCKKIMKDQRNYEEGRTTENDQATGRGDNTQQKGEKQNQAGQDDANKIYLTDHSTLQSPEEYDKDKSRHAEKDDTFSLSMDDLHETNADRRAGSDRAGTSERKDNTIGNEDLDLNDINANKKAREEDAERSEKGNHRS